MSRSHREHYANPEMIAMVAATLAGLTSANREANHVSNAMRLWQEACDQCALFNDKADEREAAMAKEQASG